MVTTSVMTFIANIRVSEDAVRQRRRFASLNGIVALISGGKVVLTQKY